MFAMEREILEQPDMLLRSQHAWQEAAKRIREGVNSRNHLAVIGRGSSGNACTFLTYVFGIHTGKHAIDFRPWVATQPAPDSNWSDVSVLAYSASGESTDIAHACQWLKTRGARIFAVTNAANSDCRLGRVAEDILLLQAGLENAVPATKSFTAQLFASAALCGLPLADAAVDTAQCLEKMFASPHRSILPEFLADARTNLWIGRGPALAAAQDAALKIQETDGIPAFAYSSAEFLHGPIGATGSCDRVVLLQDSTAEGDAVFEKLKTALRARGTPFLVIGDEGQQPGDDKLLPLPTPQQAWSRVVLQIVAGQLAALDLAKRTGRNPDKPIGLNKITIT